MRLYKGYPVFECSFGTFGFHAKSYGLFIVCPKEHSYLLEHEYTHCADFVASPFKYFFGYFFNWRARLYYELRGYSKSHYGEWDRVAYFLNKDYNMPIRLSPLDIQKLMPICVDNDVDAAINVIDSQLSF